MLQLRHPRSRLRWRAAALVENSRDQGSLGTGGVNGVRKTAAPLLALAATLMALACGGGGARRRRRRDRGGAARGAACHRDSPDRHAHTHTRATYRYAYQGADVTSHACAHTCQYVYGHAYPRTDQHAHCYAYQHAHTNADSHSNSYSYVYHHTHTHTHSHSHSHTHTSSAYGYTHAHGHTQTDSYPGPIRRDQLHRSHHANQYAQPSARSSSHSAIRKDTPSSSPAEEIAAASRVFERPDGGADWEEVDYSETSYIVHTAENFQLEAVFVLDFTNSMAQAALLDGRSGIDAMLSAFESAVLSLPGTHRIGVVEFPR